MLSSNSNPKGTDNKWIIFYRNIWTFSFALILFFVGCNQKKKKIKTKNSNCCRMMMVNIEIKFVYRPDIYIYIYVCMCVRDWVCGCMFACTCVYFYNLSCYYNFLFRKSFSVSFIRFDSLIRSKSHGMSVRTGFNVGCHTTLLTTFAALFLVLLLLILYIEKIYSVLLFCDKWFSCSIKSTVHPYTHLKIPFDWTIRFKILSKFGKVARDTNNRI